MDTIVYLMLLVLIKDSIDHLYEGRIQIFFSRFKVINFSSKSTYNWSLWHLVWELRSVDVLPSVEHLAPMNNRLMYHICAAY